LRKHPVPTLEPRERERERERESERARERERERERGTEGKRERERERKREREREREREYDVNNWFPTLCAFACNVYRYTAGVWLAKAAKPAGFPTLVMDLEVGLCTLESS
jgi:hypothetical protein